MPRRAVIAAVAAAVLAGGAASASAATGSASAVEPGQVCVLTDYDPKTGKRTGFCVWVPVEPPLSASGS